MCVHVNCKYCTLDGKIFAQPHTTLCIQFLDRENNDKNNTLPLRQQICLTIVCGCAKILPKTEANYAEYQTVATRVNDSRIPSFLYDRRIQGVFQNQSALRKN